MRRFYPNIDQDELRSYVARHAGADPIALAPGSGAALALDDGHLAGGVWFHHYHQLSQGSVCEVSVVVEDPRVVSRQVLRDFFDYPFRQLKVTRLQAVTAATNTRCVSLLERLGFTREGVLRRLHDGVVDAVVYSMLTGECRWVDASNHTSLTPCGSLERSKASIATLRATH